MNPEATTDAARRLAPDKQQGFIDALLENVEDGIVACDARGVLTVFNHAARELHGLPESPIAPDRWAEHYDLYLPGGETPMPKEEIPLFRALQGERVRDAEMVIAPKGGPARTVLVSGGPVYSPSGEKLGAVVVMRDFTERKEAQEALRRESSLLHALMDNVPDAIYFKDTEGRFTRVNRHAPYRGNKAPEEVVGKTDFDFFIEEHARAAYEDEQRIIRTGRPLIDKEEKETYPDGSITWLSTTKVPVHDEAGRVTGIVGISRDITERKLAEEARLELAREQAARAEAEQANRVKDEFLATLSHELRTPLTAVLGWAQMLAEGYLSEETRAEAYRAIYRNARAQAQLVDDLLDISRIISGTFRIEPAPVDLAAVLEAAVAGVRPAAAAKSLTLSSEIDGAGCTIRGDADRLQQVFWNLLTNAVKFTPKGGRVEVRLGRADEHVEVVVRDTGAGIRPEFLPHVFERFRQADMSTTRRHGGLGLGLSIVRHLVELHGGSVRADSEGEGRGATFTVQLPAEPLRRHNGADDIAPAAGVSARGCPDTLDGLRVLVVDDDPDARDLLRVGLGQCGAQVTAVGSAAEALVSMLLAPPDLLISDIGMAGEDGYELMRKVRALEGELCRVPAIALTAYAGAEDRAQALRAGYQMHVPKPVALAELVAVAAGLLKRGG